MYKAKALTLALSVALCPFAFCPALRTPETPLLCCHVCKWCSTIFSFPTAGLYLRPGDSPLLGPICSVVVCSQMGSVLALYCMVVTRTPLYVCPHFLEYLSNPLGPSQTGLGNKPRVIPWEYGLHRSFYFLFLPDMILSHLALVLGLLSLCGRGGTTDTIGAQLNVWVVFCEGVLRPGSDSVIYI